MESLFSKRNLGRPTVAAKPGAIRSCTIQHTLTNLMPSSNGMALSHDTGTYPGVSTHPEKPQRPVMLVGIERRVLLLTCLFNIMDTTHPRECIASRNFRSIGVSHSACLGGTRSSTCLPRANVYQLKN